MVRIETGLRGMREVQPLAEFFNAIGGKRNGGFREGGLQ